MFTMAYIEDILTELYDNYVDRVIVQQRDLLIFSSFYNIHKRGDSLTKSQGNLLLKLLNRYEDAFSAAGLNYSDELKSPEWRSKFRALDLTRKLYVEKDDSGMTWVMVKFPYQLKESFEKEIGKNGAYTGAWDSELRCRKFQVQHANFVNLQEFALANQFQIDETFVAAMSEYEEILAQQENIIPCCNIVDGEVKPLNASEEVLQWWEENREKSLADDLMLAKAMGYFYIGKPTTTIEKIASNDLTNFWHESPRVFLELAKQLKGKTCVILDRATREFNWLRAFTAVAEDVGFSKEEIKVCFRSEVAEDNGFNQWVKDSGYGGKVDTGKLLIFSHKPAKWVFKSPNDVKIIVTNNIYPPTDAITRDWMGHHPCVVYLGEIKPSKSKDKKIVKL